MILLLILMFIATGCSQANNLEYHTETGTAEGTTYRIIYKYDKSIHSDIKKLLDDFENEFSIYRPQSSISRFNRGEKLKATKSMTECIEICHKIHKESNGLFDPTLRPLISMWGFGEDNKLKQPTRHQIDSVLEFIGFDKIGISSDTVFRRDYRINLDFNAIAKGYSVDLVGKMFDSIGITDYLIEIGGEITTKGVNKSAKPWGIGIDRPIDGNYIPGADLITRIELDGHKGLATSGNYRKFILDSTSSEKITHTIDPRTGHSVSHNLLSATIIAQNTALADGYATACMVGGTEWSKEFIRRYNLRGILIYFENGQMVTWDSAEQDDKK